MSILIPKRYSLNKHTNRMVKTKDGVFVTLKQFEAAMRELHSKHYEREMLLERRIEKLGGAMVRLRPTLTDALGAYQDAHRITVAVANEVDAMVRGQR